MQLNKTSKLFMPSQSTTSNQQITLQAHGEQQVISYILQRSTRRSIGLSIGKNGLTVRVPRWLNQSQIEAALETRSRWIVDKLQQYLVLQEKVQKYHFSFQHGSYIQYLGQPLQLVLGRDVRYAVLKPVLDLSSALNAENEQKSQQALLLPLLREANTYDVGHEVKKWLRQQAACKLVERSQYWAAKMGVAQRLRKMSLSNAKTRWGSANQQGDIRLHWRLIEFAPEIFDYVLVHELAHLHEMNHSARFWRHVANAMPDYEQHRVFLRSVGSICDTK